MIIMLFMIKTYRPISEQVKGKGGEGAQVVEEKGWRGEVEL